MISVNRAQELEAKVAELMKARQADAGNMQRLIRVIADLQVRLMAMEKALLRPAVPTTPAILGPTGARVN